jgi:hypothetical protein
MFVVSHLGGGLKGRKKSAQGYNLLPVGPPPLLTLNGDVRLSK